MIFRPQRETASADSLEGLIGCTRGGLNK